MQRLVVLCVTALAAVAIYAVSAPAGQETSSASIDRRVKALEGKVRKLEGGNKTLQTRLNCIRQFVGLTVFGDPARGVGYLYRNPDTNVVVTTGVDLTRQGETSTVNIPAINQACIQRALFARVPAGRPAPAQRR